MKTKNFIAALTLSLLLVGTAIAYNSTSYTANGTYTVPAGVSYILVEAIGGGGGGGNVTPNGAAAGGTGGSYARSYLPVSAGQNYTVTIGAGGAAGGYGGNTTVNGTGGTVRASGGVPGATHTGDFNPGATTASTTGSTGTVIYSGGNASSCGSCASGGGGGAGANSSGGSSSSMTAGTGAAARTGIFGTLAGGAGGAGRNTNGAGNPGTAPGGAGGGAYNNAGSNAGGAGARGEVKITELTNNSIIVNIYNEANGTPVTGTNISISVTSDTYVTSTTTTTGQAGIELLPDETYTLTFTGGTYATRQYVVTATNNSIQTLNAYLLVSSSNTVFVIRAASGPDAGQPIPDAIATWETIINGSFATIESRLSDISGTAGPFSYSTTSLYRITVTATDYFTKQFILNPVQYTSYDINLVSSASYNYTQDYSGISLFYTPTTYTQANTNTFTFFASSPNGTFTLYNYTITYPGGNANGSGTNAYGSTLTSSFNITGATSTSTVVINYCYDTTEANIKCFTNTYPVQGIYGNYTLVDAVCSTSMGDFEKIGVATVSSMAAAGLGTLAGGPLLGGTLWLLVNGLMYKVLCFSIWLLLIPAFVGLVILGMGVAQR